MTKFFTPLLFVCAISISAYAENEQNVGTSAPISGEAQLLVHLNALSSNPDSLAPSEIKKRVGNYLPLINKNEWPLAYLHANTLLVEQAMNMELPAEAEQDLSTLLSLANAQKAEEFIVRLNLVKLEIQSNKGNQKAIDETLLILQTKADGLESIDFKGRVYGAIGLSQGKIGNYEDALQSLQYAYKLLKNSDNKTQLSNILNTLGNINKDLRKYDNALKFYTESLALSQQSNNHYSGSVISYNMGGIYLSLKEYDLAKEYAFISKSLSETIDDKVGADWAIKLLGDISIAKESWRAALEHFNSVESTFVNAGQKHVYFSLSLGQARALAELGDLTKAEEKLSQAKNILKGLIRPSFNVDYYRVSAKVYEAAGEFKKAYYELETGSNLKVELLEAEQKEQTEKFRVQFDSEIKDSQNESLKTANELNRLKLARENEQKRAWLIIALLGGLLFLASSFLLWRQIGQRNKLQSIAYLDDLTKAPNRRSILQELRKRFSEAKANDQPLLIALVDFDLFKRLNDTYGHSAGDQALINFANVAREVLRDVDAFGRFGGEEWLFVFKSVDTRSAERCFDAMREKINAISIEGIPDDYILTFSMGIAIFDKNKDKKYSHLLERADRKLYEAKEHGRDRIAY